MYTPLSTHSDLEETELDQRTSKRRKICPAPLKEPPGAPWSPLKEPPPSCQPRGQRLSDVTAGGCDVIRSQDLRDVVVEEAGESLQGDSNRHRGDTTRHRHHHGDRPRLRRTRGYRAQVAEHGVQTAGSPPLLCLHCSRALPPSPTTLSYQPTRHRSDVVLVNSMHHITHEDSLCRQVFEEMLIGEYNLGLQKIRSSDRVYTVIGGRWGELCRAAEEGLVSCPLKIKHQPLKSGRTRVRGNV